MRKNIGLSLIPGILTALALPALSQALPEGKGRDIVNAQCNSCHAFSARVGIGYTPEHWPTVMRMMRNQGLNLTPAQMAEATEYLIKNYPEKTRPEAVLVPGPVQVTMKAWRASTPGSRPHDPLATADGALWYTGQMANVLGRIDPKTGQIREYHLKTAHSGPHGLVEDKSGNIWYTGNTGALIGKLDPKTGINTEYPMPDPKVGDPHTLVFDQSGILWFTAQAANRVGRLDPKTGEIKLLTPPTANSRPYGMAVNSKGTVFYVAFGANIVASVDPKTLAIKEQRLPDAASRPRRIVITDDDIVWYADFARGYLGRLDAATGKVREYLSPSGTGSQPYGMSILNGAIWYSESGTKPGTVVRFDPQTEKFQSWPIAGGGQIVRNTSTTPDGGLVLAHSLTNEITLVTVKK